MKPNPVLFTIYLRHPEIIGTVFRSKGNGPLARIYEIYCDMVDEAGGIATLATILASNQISLKNIGIVHSREFIEPFSGLNFMMKNL